MALVRVMQVTVVDVIDVVIVTHGSVAATRPVLVRVGALMDLVGHAPTLGCRARLRKRRPRAPSGPFLTGFDATLRGTPHPRTRTVNR
jgi:hypothetical protein